MLFALLAILAPTFDAPLAGNEFEEYVSAPADPRSDAETPLGAALSVAEDIEELRWMTRKEVYHALEEMGWRSRAADAGLTIEAWPPDGIPDRIDQELLRRGYFLIPCDVYGSPGSYRVSLLSDAAKLREALAEVAVTTRA